MAKPYLQYVDDVLEGKIVAGELIKLACKRFQKDLQREDLEFREDEADRAIKFLSLLHFYNNDNKYVPLELSDWQAWIIANIVGWYYKEDGRRRFTQSHIEVARKNAKSTLASALCCYFLCADGEYNAQVLLAANSKEQAKIDFKMSSDFIESIDSKGKYFSCYRDTINFPKTKSILKVLAADTSKLDGWGASFALIDEAEEAATSKMKDVLVSGMGARKNPHLCIINTAGFNKTYPIYQQRLTEIEVLNGLKENDDVFIAIYTLDDADNPWNENVWQKSNPNLDLSVQRRFLRTLVKQAQINTSDEVNVLTKNLNVWTNVSNVWIQDSHIIKNTSNTVKIEDFKDTPCYIGVDLAAVSDLTAVSYMFVKDEHFYFFTKYYCPETALYEKADKERYRDWNREGYLTVTPSNVTDYDYITNDILKIGEIVNIASISYDKWNATSWAIKCTELGLPLEPYAQNLSSFNAPTRELERLILSDSVTFANNPIDRFCFRNSELKSDFNGNVKVIKNMGGSKSKSGSNKVDGVIAMLMALGKYLESPHYSGEIIFI